GRGPGSRETGPSKRSALRPMLRQQDSIVSGCNDSSAVRTKFEATKDESEDNNRKPGAPVREKPGATAWLHVDRTPGRHRDHRHPGVDAPARFSQSQDQGARHHVHEQSSTIAPGLETL